MSDSTRTVLRLADVVAELRKHRHTCLEGCLRCQLFDAYMARDLKTIERIECETTVPSTHHMAREIRHSWGEGDWTCST